MTATRAKALAILREGRCTVVHASLGVDRALATAPTQVIAYVTSSRPGTGHHVVDLVDGEWKCTGCTTGCPHIAAVRLVTGHGEAS